MARRAAKRDANEPAIVAALEAVGCHVQKIDADDGTPDLVVAYPDRSLYIDDPCLWSWQMCYMEVKGPNGKLTPVQEKWWAGWRERVDTGDAGPAYIVHSAEEALKIVRGY